MNIATASARSVREIVFALLQERNATIEVVASCLGTSTRSLQRCLAGLGTSYREILEEVTLAAACSLLIGTDMSIFEIASRVGYSGPSSFSRSFSRVMKTSPSVYRQSHKLGVYALT